MIELKSDTDKIERVVKSTKFLSRLYNQGSQAHYYQLLCDYYTRLRAAPQNGEFVVAHTMFLPVEILHALDIVPLHLEYTGYMMSLFSGSCNDVLEVAAGIGLAPEICSSHRLIGGALKIGALPHADAVVCSNLQCDNAPKSGELVMEHFGCPGFIFDYPYHQNESGKKYILRELNALIDFLEQVSGHKMNWDKLSANMVEINKQITLVQQISELCKNSPSPLQPQDFLKFLAVDYLLAGIPELTKYLEALYTELSGMVAKGKGFTNPERIRLLGLMIPPWHFQGEVDRILTEHHAAIVCYPNLCNWSPDIQINPNKPLESVAEKLAMGPAMRMFGTIDHRAISPIQACVEDYRIDGAINFTHMGYRQMGPSNKIFKEILDEMDVPTLNIDCDLVDRTVTSGDEVQNKMEQFFEMLEDR